MFASEFAVSMAVSMEPKAVNGQGTLQRRCVPMRAF